jgi:tRNA(Arg) A34 adenosine deaminase TadA
VAKAWNQVETLKDATAHAEVLVITAAEPRSATGGSKRSTST